MWPIHASLRRQIQTSAQGERAARRSFETPPSASATRDSEKSTIRLYRVQRGDTLRSISKAFYGSEDFWTDLYQANRMVLDAPDRVSLGTILHIPDW